MSFFSISENFGRNDSILSDGDALMADKRNIYPKPFLRWAGGKVVVNKIFGFYRRRL